MRQPSITSGTFDTHPQPETRSSENLENSLVVGNNSAMVYVQQDGEISRVEGDFAWGRDCRRGVVYGKFP